MSESSGTRRSAVSAWLEMLRIPNLPGVAGNVLVGFLLVAGRWQPVNALALAIAASLLFYVAGLIGNDVADAESDRERRPGRPIPSGRISAGIAKLVMYAAFLLGLVCACSLVTFTKPDGARRWSVVVAFALIVCIVCYNTVFKRWLVSALFMGLCRGLNLLLGVTAAMQWCGLPSAPGPGWSVWVAVTAISLFVAGLTLVARDEAAMRPRRWVVVMGLLAQVAGLAGYLLLPRFLSGEAGVPGPWFDGSFSVLIAAIAFTVLRRGVMAAWSTNPRAIRTAVLISLVSITTLDAAVAWLATGQLVFAVTLLGLLGVSLILREFASPT